VTPLTLTLPMPPNMANGRVHWRAKNRERQNYLRECELRVLAKLIPPPGIPMERVRIDSTLHVWATMDDDNALARIKWGADFLKYHSYIVDDKRPHCRFTIPEQVIDRKDQRLVITLTPSP
jgi:hypothetical protein